MAKKNSLNGLTSVAGEVVAKDGNFILSAEQAEAIEKHIAESSEMIGSLNKANEELEKQNAAIKQAGKSKGVLHTVQVEGKTYMFTAPKFSAKNAAGEGKVYTAEEAAKDKDLVATLLAKKSGILAEVK